MHSTIINTNIRKSIGTVLIVKTFIMIKYTSNNARNIIVKKPKRFHIVGVNFLAYIVALVGN